MIVITGCWPVILHLLGLDDKPPLIIIQFLDMELSIGAIRLNLVVVSFLDSHSGFHQFCLTNSSLMSCLPS